MAGASNLNPCPGSRAARQPAEAELPGAARASAELIFEAPGMRVYLRRTAGGVERLGVASLDRAGGVVGETVFGPMRLGRAQPLLLTLLDARGSFSELPVPGDPHPAAHRLRGALGLAVQDGLKFNSTLGASPAEITGALRDALTEELSLPELRRLLQVNRLLPGIYQVHAPTQHLLASTFLRFQEFYESPRFRGRTFALKAYQRWYRTAGGDGSFSYYEDWGGFNIPDYVLKPFRQGRCNPLSKRERVLLLHFRGKNPPFYVLGTSGADCAQYLRHELAHGLYYTNPDYRAEVMRALLAVDTSSVMSYLKRAGYHAASFADEAHAYLLDDPQYLRAKGVRGRGYAAVHRRLSRIFERFAGPLNQPPAQKSLFMASRRKTSPAAAASSRRSVGSAPSADRTNPVRS